jgi:ubiquinone/menaquinone biosynthesis C-methylase UbiE
MSARYDAVADFYVEGFSDDYGDDLSVALFELVGPVREVQVLDVACGHGRMSRELARRGAQVTAIDISAALIARARDIDRDEPLDIEYLVGDASSPDALEGRAFDVAVCSMGLSDIDDLHGVLATVARVLSSGGQLVISMLHPCFPGGEGVSSAWPSTKTYYDEGWWRADGKASSLRRQVGANHRMLSTYLNAFTRAGLRIDELREPLPTREWREGRPDAARYPVFLVARLVRE